MRTPLSNKNCPSLLMRTLLSDKNCPSLWLALPPEMISLKFSPPLCSSKSHKYDNYYKTTYIPLVLLPQQASSPGSPHLLPQAELTLPPFHQYTKKDILKCT